MINRYSKGQGNSPAPQQNWWDRLSQQSVSDAIMNQQRPQSQIPQMGEIPNTMPALQQPPTAIPNQMAQGAPMAGAPLGGAPLGEAQGGMPAPNAMAMQNANPNAAFQSPQPNAMAFQNANQNARFQPPPPTGLSQLASAYQSAQQTLAPKDAMVQQNPSIIPTDYSGMTASSPEYQTLMQNRLNSPQDLSAYREASMQIASGTGGDRSTGTVATKPTSTTSWPTR